MTLHLTPAPDKYAGLTPEKRVYRRKVDETCEDLRRSLEQRQKAARMTAVWSEKEEGDGEA